MNSRCLIYHMSHWCFFLYVRATLAAPFGAAEAAVSAPRLLNFTPLKSGWVRDRLRWNEGQEKHMDCLGIFFLEGGLHVNPTSACRVIAWSKAFRTFESELGEMWRTWTLSALLRAIPSRGCREPPHRDTPVSSAETGSAEWWGWGCGAGHSRSFSPLRRPSQTSPCGTSLRLPSWGAAPLLPLSVLP